MRKVGYLSLQRVWNKSLAFGAGVGWDSADRSMCVFLQLGFWVLLIGPHYKKAAQAEGEA